MKAATACALLTIALMFDGRSAAHGQEGQGLICGTCDWWQDDNSSMRYHDFGEEGPLHQCHGSPDDPVCHYNEEVFGSCEDMHSPCGDNLALLLAVKKAQQEGYDGVVSLAIAFPANIRFLASQEKLQVYGCRGELLVEIVTSAGTMARVLSETGE